MCNYQQTLAVNPYQTPVDFVSLSTLRNIFRRRQCMLENLTEAAPGVYFVAVANTKNHNANLDDSSPPQSFEVLAQSESTK